MNRLQPGPAILPYTRRDHPLPNRLARQVNVMKLRELLRRFLLANSATIIQDDSGIPLASYDPKKWRFFPFGRYDGPIAEFAGRYQPQYAELFRRSQSMDFGIGYRWRSHESNLLLAVKLPSDDSEHVASTSSTESPHLTSPKRQRRPRPP